MSSRSASLSALLVALVSSVSAINTTPSSVTVIGSLTNPGITRDSCSSGNFGPLGTLWICRDTQPVVNGATTLPVVANTGAVSGTAGSGSLNLTSPGLSTPYLPFDSATECGTYGVCSDGTRYVGWPNTGPVVTFNYAGSVNGYMFVPKQHISGLTVEGGTYYSLYHLGYVSGQSSLLPTVSLDYKTWWGTSDIGYGAYGSVVQGNYAYLFGTTSSNQMALARVNLGSNVFTAIETLSQYEYWVNGAWTTTKPSLTSSGVAISNAFAGGQGTYYYSTYWSSYVWVGGDGYPNANFYVTTAPDPTGPWTTPKLFYTGAGGSSTSLPAYSSVAHPELSTVSPSGKELYISWTQNNANGVYNNPLAHVVWP
ncbi:hypothetical protein DL93DRAFT_2233881 [Clavulina sp. PMI_390]|nr:hypothetical protein DL93DRAFT_2233881 [Clavulina sp. PMI_390]